MTLSSPLYDALVIGSGFSGSLLAWILSRQGQRVLLIDRWRHPRFAIGESSTPTADFLLAHLADRWNLPQLAPFACWGAWKKAYPGVTCGKKRGFSYYRHHRDTPFSDDSEHSRSMLVAASVSDYWSDTHWLRSSVDAFFAQQAVAAGTELLEEHQIVRASFDPSSHRWQTDLEAVTETSRGVRTLQARWIVDASGPGCASASFVSNPCDDHWMRTRTEAIYGHFANVSPFAAGFADDDPFCGDDAAQHHLLDEGWCWMLRMDHDTTSVGVVRPLTFGNGTHQTLPSPGIDANPGKAFGMLLECYPSLASLMESAQFIAPGPSMQHARRLSRCRRSGAGPGWILLPGTYGFVDPLHSTGIAHALSGVMRVAEALTASPPACHRLLAEYSSDLRDEIRWIDTLVAGCYAAQPCFDQFLAFACFYFIAAIEFEKQLARDPTVWANGFLQCQQPELTGATEEVYRMLSADAPTHSVRQLVRQLIAPWNSVGLLEPQLRNRISHSAPPKYASLFSRFEG